MAYATWLPQATGKLPLLWESSTKIDGAWQSRMQQSAAANTTSSVKISLPAAGKQQVKTHTQDQQEGELFGDIWTSAPKNKPDVTPELKKNQRFRLVTQKRTPNEGESALRDVMTKSGIRQDPPIKKPTELPKITKLPEMVSSSSPGHLFSQPENLYIHNNFGKQFFEIADATPKQDPQQQSLLVPPPSLPLKDGPDEVRQIKCTLNRITTIAKSGCESPVNAERKPASPIFKKKREKIVVTQQPVMRQAIPEPATFRLGKSNQRENESKIEKKKYRKLKKYQNASTTRPTQQYSDNATISIASVAPQLAVVEVCREMLEQKAYETLHFKEFFTPNGIRRTLVDVKLVSRPDGGKKSDPEIIKQSASNEVNLSVNKVKRNSSLKIINTSLAVENSVAVVNNVETSIHEPSEQEPKVNKESHQEESPKPVEVPSEEESAQNLPEDSMEKNPRQDLSAEDSKDKNTRQDLSAEDSKDKNTRQDLPAEDSTAEDSMKKNPQEDLSAEDLSAEGSTEKCPQQDLSAEDSTEKNPQQDLSAEDSTEKNPQQDLSAEDSTEKNPQQDLSAENSTEKNPQQDLSTEEMTEKTDFSAEDSTEKNTEQDLSKEDSKLVSMLNDPQDLPMEVSAVQETDENLTDSRVAIVPTGEVEVVLQTEPEMLTSLRVDQSNDKDESIQLTTTRLSFSGSKSDPISESQAGLSPPVLSKLQRSSIDNTSLLRRLSNLGEHVMNTSQPTTSIDEQCDPDSCNPEFEKSANEPAVQTGRSLSADSTTKLLPEEQPTNTTEHELVEEHVDDSEKSLRDQHEEPAEDINLKQNIQCSSSTKPDQLEQIDTCENSKITTIDDWEDRKTAETSVQEGELNCPPAAAETNSPTENLTSAATVESNSSASAHFTEHLNSSTTEHNINIVKKPLPRQRKGNRMSAMSLIGRKPPHMTVDSTVRSLSLVTTQIIRNRKSIRLSDSGNTRKSPSCSLSESLAESLLISSPKRTNVPKPLIDNKCKQETDTELENQLNTSSPTTPNSDKQPNPEEQEFNPLLDVDCTDSNTITRRQSVFDVTLPQTETPAKDGNTSRRNTVELEKTDFGMVLKASRRATSLTLHESSFGTAMKELSDCSQIASPLITLNDNNDIFEEPTALLRLDKQSYTQISLDTIRQCPSEGGSTNRSIKPRGKFTSRISNANITDICIAAVEQKYRDLSGIDKLRLSRFTDVPLKIRRQILNDAQRAFQSSKINSLERILNSTMCPERHVDVVADCRYLSDSLLSGSGCAKPMKRISSCSTVSKRSAVSDICGQTTRIKPDPVSHIAILIAIDDYNDRRLPSCKHALSDLLSLEHLLNIQGYTTNTMHSHSPDPSRIPTKENIQKFLSSKRITKPNQQLLIYITGRGLFGPLRKGISGGFDEEHEGYILPQDTTLPNDGIMTSTAVLTTDEIRLLVSTPQAKKSTRNTDTPLKEDNEDVIRDPIIAVDAYSIEHTILNMNTQYRHGFGTITCSNRTTTGGEFSVTYTANQSGGMLSYYLMKAFDGSATRDGKLTINGINLYLKNKLLVKGREQVMKTNADNLQLGDTELLPQLRKSKREIATAKLEASFLPLRFCVSLVTDVAEYRDDTCFIQDFMQHANSMMYKETITSKRTQQLQRKRAASKFGGEMSMSQRQVDVRTIATRVQLQKLRVECFENLPTITVEFCDTINSGRLDITILQQWESDIEAWTGFRIKHRVITSSRTVQIDISRGTPSQINNMLRSFCNGNPTTLCGYKILKVSKSIKMSFAGTIRDYYKIDKYSRTGSLNALVGIKQISLWKGGEEDHHCASLIQKIWKGFRFRMLLKRCMEVAMNENRDRTAIQEEQHINIYLIKDDFVKLLYATCENSEANNRAEVEDWESEERLVICRRVLRHANLFESSFRVVVDNTEQQEFSLVTSLYYLSLLYLKYQSEWTSFTKHEKQSQKMITSRISIRNEERRARLHIANKMRDCRIPVPIPRELE